MSIIITKIVIDYGEVMDVAAVVMVEKRLLNVPSVVLEFWAIVVVIEVTFVANVSVANVDVDADVVLEDRVDMEDNVLTAVSVMFWKDVVNVGTTVDTFWKDVVNVGTSVDKVI